MIHVAAGDIANEFSGSASRSFRRLALAWIIFVVLKFVIRSLRFVCARMARNTNLLVQNRSYLHEIQRLRRELIVRGAELQRTKRDLQVIRRIHSPCPAEGVRSIFSLRIVRLQVAVQELSAAKVQLFFAHHAIRQWMPFI